MVGEISVSIAASIIYDSAKRFLRIRGEQKDSLQDSLVEFLEKNMSDEYDELVKMAGFEHFFRTPQVVDILNSSIEYIVNGHMTETVNAIRRECPNAREYMGSDHVIAYLADSFLKYKQNSVTAYDGEQIRRFFAHMLELSQKFFYHRLSTDKKIETIRSSVLTIRMTNRLLKRLNTIEQLLKKSTEYAFITNNPTFNEERAKYMGILHRKFNKAAIYLLDDFELNKFYIPPTLSMAGMHFASLHIDGNIVVRPSIRSDESWTNIFTNDNIVYITGGAGYGKSLLIQNIIVNYSNLNIAGGEDHIVIYGEIKWFINEDGSYKTMLEFIKLCISQATMMTVTDEFIQYHLRMGRCVLLLDALDEVPMEKRRDLHKTLIAYLGNINPNNKACITSRDRGFIPAEDEIEHFSIKPLFPSQIEQYVDKIIALGKFRKQDRTSFLEQARRLIEKGFLSSFMVLSLLINIYKGERELPETKLELYQKCLEYIANKRERPKTKGNFNWDHIAHLMKDNTFIELAIMCYPNNREVKEADIVAKLMEVYSSAFLDAATLDRAVTEFLKFCSERTELFVPANVENSYKFFHRSFFEYFYSKYIVTRCKGSADIYQKLLGFDVDSEAFELTLARLKQETYERYKALIEYVFKKCLIDLSAKRPKLRPLNMLTLFLPVMDEETYMREYIAILVNNAQVITKRIDKLSNQELVLNAILRSNNAEAIIQAYKRAAYRECAHTIAIYDTDDLKSIIETEKPGAENVTITQNGFPCARMHFYASAMLMSRSASIVIRDILAEPAELPKNVCEQLKKLNQYIGTLDENERRFIDDHFSMISRVSTRIGVVLMRYVPRG